MSKGCGAAHGWVNIYRESAEHIARLKREDNEYTVWHDFVTDRTVSHQSLEHISKLIEALTTASWIAYVIDGRMDMESVVKMEPKYQRIDTSKGAVDQLIRQLHSIQTLLMEREQKRANDGVQTVVACADDDDDDDEEMNHASHHQQCKVERKIEQNNESPSDEENEDSTCIVS